MSKEVKQKAGGKLKRGEMVWGEVMVNLKKGGLSASQPERI